MLGGGMDMSGGMPGTGCGMGAVLGPSTTAVGSGAMPGSLGSSPPGAMQGLAPGLASSPLGSLPQGLGTVPSAMSTPGAGLGALDTPAAPSLPSTAKPQP